MRQDRPVSGGGGRTPRPSNGGDEEEPDEAPTDPSRQIGPAPDPGQPSDPSPEPIDDDDPDEDPSRPDRMAGPALDPGRTTTTEPPQTDQAVGADTVSPTRFGETSPSPHLPDQLDPTRDQTLATADPVTIQHGGETVTAHPTEVFADEREQFAQQLGIDPRQVVIQDADEGYQFTVAPGVQREMAAGEFQEQRQQLADELGVEPHHIETTPTDDGVELQVSREAQERLLREQIEEEHGDVDDLEIEEEDGELVARFEVDEGYRMTTLEEWDEVATGVITLPAVAGGTAAAGASQFADDPRGTAEDAAESIESALRRLDPRGTPAEEAVAAGGILVATPEPATSAIGLGIIGAGAGAAIAHEAGVEPDADMVRRQEQHEAHLEATAAAVTEIDVPEHREDFEVVEMPVEDAEVVETEPEIAVPEQSVDEPAEIEAPEEPTLPPEVETPERPDTFGERPEVPIMEQAELISEFEREQDRRERDAFDPVIEEGEFVTADEILHPEEMRRRLEGHEEQEFEEVEEDVVTITPEDLADPEELRAEEEEELAQQQEWFEEFAEEQRTEAETDEVAEETEEAIEDELEPLEERDEDLGDLLGRGEAFAFIEAPEVELEADAEAQLQEQLEALELAQAPRVDTATDELVGPAIDTEPATEEIELTEVAQETAVDVQQDFAQQQAQAFEQMTAAEPFAADPVMATGEPFEHFHEFEHALERDTARFALPPTLGADEFDDLDADLGIDDARWEWELPEPDHIDPGSDPLEGLDDL